MFHSEHAHKPLPPIKRRRGESPPKIGSGQVLKETSIYRVQWYSYFPEKWIKDNANEQLVSRGRLTSQGWVVAVTQDSEMEDYARDLYVWHRTGKEFCQFSLHDMQEDDLATSPDRVCPIFEVSQSEDVGQLVGLAFVSSAGEVRFWSHYTDSTHYMNGSIPLADLEVCTSLANAHVPDTVSLVCGTSHGRIFLLRCTDASNVPCDAIVTEVVRSQGMITRLFRFGGTQQTSAVKRVISLQNSYDSVSQENGGTFVLTENNLSFWRLSSNNSHTFLWEDKLNNILTLYPEAKFLDVVCRKEKSVTHELLLLCRSDDLCFVAVLDVLDSSSKPQLTRCIECTVPPREDNEHLRIVSVEGSVLAAFVVGALSVTNVPFQAVDGKEKDHVFNRIERAGLACLGAGVHDGAVYVLADGYGVLTLQPLRPVADKHPRARLDEEEEDEKKDIEEESNPDVSRQLDIAFALYLDRTKTWQQKVQKLSEFAVDNLNQAVVAYTHSLVQSRPRSDYKVNTDLTILRHHMIQKRSQFQEFMQFLQQSGLWEKKLDEQTHLRVLEMGEKLTITEKFWEIFQETSSGSNSNISSDGSISKDEKSAFLQRLIEREKDGLAPIEVFFSDVLNIGSVIIKFDALLPFTQLEYGGSEKEHTELLQWYLIANTCVEVILWEGIQFRHNYKLSLARPWTYEKSIFNGLREHANKLVRVLKNVQSDEGLLHLRELLFDSCYRMFRGCLSQKPAAHRLSGEFEQDVSYLVGVLQQASETLEDREKAKNLVVSLAGEFSECAQLVNLCPVDSSQPMVSEGNGESDTEDAIHWHCLRSADGIYYVNSTTKQITFIQPACFGDDKLVEFLRSKCSQSNSSSYNNVHTLSPLIALLHWVRPRNLTKFTTALFDSYIKKRRLSAVALTVCDALSEQAKGSSLLPTYPFGGSSTLTDTLALAVFQGASKQLLEDYDALLRAYLTERRELAWLHAIHEKDFATCTSALLDSADDLSTAQRNTRLNLAFLAARIAPAGTESDRLTLAQAEQYLTSHNKQPSSKRLRAVDGDGRTVSSSQQLFSELRALGINERDPRAIVFAFEVYQLLTLQEPHTDDAIQTWQSIFEMDHNEWKNLADARDNDINSQLPEQVQKTLLYQVLKFRQQKTGHEFSDVVLLPLRSYMQTLEASIQRALDIVLRTIHA